jgi:predicted protein tyrosine phosphatase
MERRVVTSRRPDTAARIRIRDGSALTGINERSNLAASWELSSAGRVGIAVLDILPIKITVCGFAELAEECEPGPSHVLSLLDPGVPVPPELGSFADDQRLELRFHDIIEEQSGMFPPEPEHVRQLLALGRDVLTGTGDDRHLLIHCHAGFSRSPAAFALLLAQAQPCMPAESVAAEVLRIRPTAWPNLRIVELGDRMLGRNGELVEAAWRIYRYRLAEDPGLGEMLIANGRAREVEAGRARKGVAALNPAAAPPIRR